MLSLGLVLAFSASAFAADVKFYGSLYVAGMYLDRISLRDSTLSAGGSPVPADVSSSASTAFYYQRLRVGTDFIVSPGLKLVTRFDALERIWGGVRSAASITAATGSAGTLAENENIAFDWAYINYASPIGTFDVGMMNDGSTGTIFGNSLAPAGRIKYSYTMGPATLNASCTKVEDKSNSYVTNTVNTDGDRDKWGVEGVYAWKDGKAGVQVAYYRYAQNKPASHYINNYLLFTPYAIAKIGPVALQAELNYATGHARSYDSALSASNQTMDQISGWIDATADFGKVYFGGTFAYISGDDPATTGKVEGGTLHGGTDWNPALIMFNQDRVYWAGALGGFNSTTNTSPMSNAWFFQGRVGVKPLAALDIMASVSLAYADKKPTGVLSNNYGWEVDVTGTYKITNNLSYMLGAGYLKTGDYYKGTNDQQGLNNNYMLINKITLTF